MQKRLQNRIMESRMALPGATAYAVVIWLIGSLLLTASSFTADGLMEGSWASFACFLASAYLMVEMSTINALIRIYSRCVTCSFIVLTCAANFMVSDFSASLVRLCMVAFYVLLFPSYQDKKSAGYTFYAFLCLGMASLAFVQVLWYVPIVWMVMFFMLASLSWRTLKASLIGLMTPYWFLLPVTLYQQQFGWVTDHFAALIAVEHVCDWSLLTLNQWLTLVFVLTMAGTGIIHYWRNSSGDRFRVRQLYGIFIAMTAITTVYIVVQPQHYDILLGLLIVNTAPLIGHFLALTHTRITNYAFIAICVTALLLTLFNLWMPSLPF